MNLPVKTLEALALHGAKRVTASEIVTGDWIVNLSNGKRTRVLSAEPWMSGYVRLTLDNGQPSTMSHGSSTYNIAA